ncbi:hypothetical protein [Epilithonimonas sp. UC225_85]|uniref:hypothetical protein n=1 Tax=Epilithonimonas sp. UC225_85 TaxID=3350167 RepID=UPI0036D3A5A0
MENLDELKLRIIQRLNKIDDIDILMKINDFIFEFENFKGNEVKEGQAMYGSKIYFSESQKRMLAEAENDIKEGRFHTYDEVRKMTEKWLR